MTASRTSNKQILEAIEAQTSAITALAAAISGTPAASPEPVATTSVDVAPVADKPVTPRVKPEYLTHMKGKAQDHANNKGEEVVLYARVNGMGEHKLAYCLKPRWTSLRDKGLIGAIALFN